jgi:hypothetical protein
MHTTEWPLAETLRSPRHRRRINDDKVSGLSRFVSELCLDGREVEIEGWLLKDAC